MEYLYAPWRREYVTRQKIEGCVFCYISKHPEDDEELQVLFRDEVCFIVMNRYPYSPGHIMIIPHHHTDKLEELEEKSWMHICSLAQKCVKLLKDTLNVKGVNLGMNLGKSAGAGIAEHIHLHLVPRWEGDTNFITTIGNTRVYSTDFIKLYKKLKEQLPNYIKV